MASWRVLFLGGIFVAVLLQLAGGAWAVDLKTPVQSKSAKKKAVSPVFELPKFLKELESKYASAETLMASFTQTTESAALQQKKVSSGVLIFKRPNKVRWETIKPDPNLLVSDGRKVWFYTPPFDATEDPSARGQVIERPASALQTKLVHALLSGAFSVARDMKILQKGSARFELFPKKGSAGTVVRAEITVDPDKKLIEKVILDHRGGNRAEIRLNEIQLGKKIEDSLFKFAPPPNTDRIQE